MSRYDVNSANTNRHVRFLISPANAADANASLFGMLKGRAPTYPHYGQLIGTPTANQELAQLRTSLVVRALTAYTVAVGVEMADDSFGTGGLTQTAAPALILTFEVDEQGEYFNQNWTGDTTLDKHEVTDRTDVLGTGGMSFVKTKPGLQSLVDTLANVSYDGGSTGPFGDLSTTGAIALPDGTVTAGAPVLDNAGGSVGPGVSGLAVTWLGQ